MHTMKFPLKNPIIYVTRDLERVAGLDFNTPGLFIISNYCPFAKLFEKHPNLLLIKEKNPLDTWEILNKKEAQNFINRHENPRIVVFKNTLQIEKTCQSENWELLNPKSRFANQIEEKISQTEWMGELKRYFPDYKVRECGEVKWKKEKFILQFNRSHTGSGTTLIKSKKQLEEIKQKFPFRPVRIAEYIPGPLYTNNNIVWDDKILLGNISYQITGLQPFTDIKFATIGNDWSLPQKKLTENQFKKYKEIAEAVGSKMRREGWKGLFGIDVVADEKTDKLYLLEINARQPASASFESILQKQKQRLGSKKITVLEAHLNALSGKKYDQSELIKIDDGAQIVQRVKEGDKKYDYGTIKKEATKKDLITVKYNNRKTGADLIRFQSTRGIMADHNKFNSFGKKICSLLKR